MVHTRVFPARLASRAGECAKTATTFPAQTRPHDQMSEADYAVLRKVRSVFDGVPYCHRNSSTGDRVAQFVYEDLYALDNFSASNTLLEGDRQWPTDGRKHKHPIGNFH